MAQESAFDEGADGGLFVEVELVDGFEVRAQAGVWGPRSSSLKTSASVLTESAIARAFRTSRVGWLVPAS